MHAMAEEPLFVENRIVVIVTPRAPLVDWMNRVFGDVADPVSIDEARADPNAFLIPARLDEDVPGARWLKRNWAVIFDQMLRDWCVDESVWPNPRTRKMFDQWCEIHEHHVVLDCTNEPLIYDDDVY
jgi:hypothetical protein